MKAADIKNILLLIFLAGIIGLIFFLRQQNNPAYDPQLVNGVFVETPRNMMPLEESTPLYDKKEIVIADADKQPHRFTYFWKEPLRAARAGEKFPLVLILHGSTGKSYAGRYLAAEPLRSKYPAYIMVPVLPDGTLWAFPDQVQPEYINLQPMTSSGIPRMMPYIIAMVTQAITNHPIDPRRIYVVGCSQGGFGAFGAVRDYPGLFAGAVSISGGWDITDAPRLTQVPLLAIHGALDENIPAGFSRDVTALINEYRGHAIYNEIPQMNHQCPAPQLYGEAMWSWLFRQSR